MWFSQLCCPRSNQWKILRRCRSWYLVPRCYFICDGLWQSSLWWR